MPETPLNKDQLPPLELDDLQNVTADGKAAFLEAQTAGPASASNRLATMADVLGMSSGVLTRIGILQNPGFTCGLDCWENEAPYPIGALPQTETEKIQVHRVFAGPVGSDQQYSCGCPGLGVRVLAGYEGCSFEAVAQKRDYKCCDLLVCDPEMYLDLRGYIWRGESADEQTFRPYVRIEYWNEGVYQGERQYYLSDPIEVTELVTEINIQYNFSTSCCADELRVILGFDTPEASAESGDGALLTDHYIHVQNFQIVGQLGASFAPFCAEAYDNPVINMVSTEGVVHYSLAACEGTTLLERAEEPAGWTWNAGAQTSGNYELVDVISNQDLQHTLAQVGAGFEVQRTTQHDPGPDPVGSQYVHITSPSHRDSVAGPNTAFDIDYEFARGWKWSQDHEDAGFIRLYYRYASGGYPAADAAWVFAAQVAFPPGVTSPSSFTVNLETLGGSGAGTYDFCVTVEDGAGAVYLSSQLVRIFYTGQVPGGSDLIERPLRFVNPFGPRFQHFQGIRVRRSLDRFADTQLRPAVSFLDLSYGQRATHFKVYGDMSLLMSGPATPINEYNTAPIQGTDPYDVENYKPLVMLVDANGQERVVGRLTMPSSEPAIANNLSEVHAEATLPAPIGTTTVIPIEWITGQLVASSNSNALVPFDYTKVQFLDIVIPGNQFLLNSLTIELGTEDAGGGSLGAVLETIEVDLAQNYTTDEQVHQRWTQVGPASVLRPTDDSRHYWWQAYYGDLNFDDEAEVESNGMQLFSRRALNNMSTSMRECVADEQEFDVNYIGLTRSQEFTWGDAPRDIFYSVIRRTFDGEDEGYLDISSVCEIGDSLKKRYIFPDIQFTAATLENHLYQFQASLVDDRGNKLVGAWTPVITPRNEEIICRTERWADTGTFNYNNGTFRIDEDTLYASQIEDFNFTRVSELTVRVMGVREQIVVRSDKWDEYQTPPFPSLSLDWQTPPPYLFELQLTPVDWHEGELVVNLNIAAGDEPPPPGSAGVLDNFEFQWELQYGYVSDRLNFKGSVASETGQETSDYTLRLETLGHAYADRAECIASFLIGGLPATVRNGQADLFMKVTIIDASGLIAPADMPRVLNLQFKAAELALTLDDRDLNEPCIALTNFQVQGPAGSIVLDDLSDYDLDNDPAGAIQCFRRRWSELAELSTLTRIDSYNIYNGITEDVALRLVQHDGGTMCLFDDLDPIPTGMPWEDWEVLQFITELNPQRPFNTHIATPRSNNTTIAGTPKPGWHTMFKMAPVVELTWDTVDAAGDPVTYKPLVVLDLDWGVLAGRATMWADGAVAAADANKIWISKRELEDIGVFLVDPLYDDLDPLTEIAIQRAGFFIEPYSNQIHAYDFWQFDVDMLGNTVPGNRGIGEELLGDLGRGADPVLYFDANLPFTFMDALGAMGPAIPVSQADLNDRSEILFNRVDVTDLIFNQTINGTTRLAKSQRTAYTPAVGVDVTVYGEPVGSVGYFLPKGVDVLPGLAMQVDLNVAPSVPPRYMGFAVAKTNYGRQLISEQIASTGGSVTLTFSAFTVAESVSKVYEPCNWEYGRVFVDENSEVYFNQSFRDNLGTLGTEKVCAFEFYLFNIQQGPGDPYVTWTFRVEGMRADDGGGGGYQEIFDPALDTTFAGYDPETAARVFRIDESSDRNFCQVHEAAVNLRSNRSVGIMHFRRPSDFGYWLNDRVTDKPLWDFDDWVNDDNNPILVADLRSFGPCYLMLVWQNLSGDWQSIDEDSTGASLVVEESEEMRNYQRASVQDRWDRDDTTSLTYYKKTDKLEWPGGHITGVMDGFYVVVVPFNSIHGPSVDVDDLSIYEDVDGDGTVTHDYLRWWDTFDYFTQVALLREWETIHSPGAKVDQSLVGNFASTQLHYDPFQINVNGARRGFQSDFCGDFDAHNELELEDGMSLCKLPLVFSAEPDHVRYYDDPHYDEGGRGTIWVPSYEGNDNVDENKARTGYVYFNDEEVRGVNNMIAGSVYQKHTGCCLGVPERTRTVEFTNPECGCISAPRGIQGLDEFITHPKLPQIITDDNWAVPLNPVSSDPLGITIRRDEYGQAVCIEYRTDAGWVELDVTDPDRFAFAGGGRPDPAILVTPPGDGLWAILWCGPNSAAPPASSTRQVLLATDAILEDVYEHTFEVTPWTSGFIAEGMPVWIRCGCSEDNCSYDLCDVMSYEDVHVRGVYGVITDVDVPGGEITVQFNEPVTASFTTLRKTELLVSPDGAMGFYLELGSGFRTQVTDPDPNAAMVRWGFRYWEAPESLFGCGCGDGGSYICDSDGESVFHELIGSDTGLPVKPHDFFGTWSPPAPFAFLLEDADPGQDYLEVCNPEKFQDFAPIAVVDNIHPNGFIATVIYRDIVNKRLYLDRLIPVELCGWPYTPGSPFPGFKVSEDAIVYHLVDFHPFDPLNISTLIDHNSRPDFGKVHVDMENGVLVFHPNQASDFWVRWYGTNTRHQLPAVNGVYRLVGVDACGRRTSPSETITVLSQNRLNQFFAERGWQVVDGEVMPLDPPYPDWPTPPPAGDPYGGAFFGDHSSPGPIPPPVSPFGPGFSPGFGTGP